MFPECNGVRANLAEQIRLMQRADFGVMHAVFPCVVEIGWKMLGNSRNLCVFAGVYLPMVDAIRQPVSMCWQIRHASRCSHGPDPLLDFFCTHLASFSHCPAG